MISGIINAIIAIIIRKISLSRLLNQCLIDNDDSNIDTFEYKGKIYDKGKYIKGRCIKLEELNKKQLNNLIKDATSYIENGKIDELQKCELEALKITLSSKYPNEIKKEKRITQSTQKKDSSDKNQVLIQNTVIQSKKEAELEQQDTETAESKAQEKSEKLNNQKNNVPLIIALITVSIIAIICVISLCVVATKSTNSNLTTTTPETTVTTSTTTSNNSWITLSDEQREKIHEEVEEWANQPEVKKKNITEQYNNLIDRDKLLSKNYGKVKSDDNNNVKSTIGMQKELYQTFINDKDALISIFGEKKYNKMLKNIKNITNRNYYKDNDYLDWDYIDAVAKEKDNEEWKKEKNDKKPDLDVE